MGTFRLHPRRQAILDALQARPGCSFRTLVRMTGIATGCARHHLSVLERRHAAWSARVGHRLAIFPGQRPAAPAELVLASQLDALDQRLVALVRQGPVRGQAPFFQACPNVPHSSLQHRLARLQRLGLLQVQPQGRYHVHTLAPILLGLDALRASQEVPA